MPVICDHGISVKSGRHLLIDGVADPVDYGMGECAGKDDNQSVALLTGANSGGKTTMLELLAHCTILAHMGLPVPAQSAKVVRIESIPVLEKAGCTQSAGALDSAYPRWSCERPSWCSLSHSSWHTRYVRCGRQETGSIQVRSEAP